MFDLWEKITSSFGMLLQSIIPAFYHSFLPDIIKLNIPEETIATCDNCILCQSSQSPYLTTKCCGYYPKLPNYIVGAILCDQDKTTDTGREKLLGQISNRTGTTPYGVLPSAKYKAQRKVDVLDRDFGNPSGETMESLKCPYYNDGLCDIYKYRENICFTFFCHSVGGASGILFWEKISSYFKMIESNLSQYVMAKMGWPASKIKTESVSASQLNLADQDGKLIPGNYSQLWGEWEGKEVEFYVKCFELFKNMNTVSFKKVFGFKEEILRKAIEEILNDFQQKELARFMALHTGIALKSTVDGNILLSLGDQSAELPSVMYSVIKAFNGKRSTAEVFRLANKILLNISEKVDELWEKGMLIPSST
jgi:Fe-S-cluster containining protein